MAFLALASQKSLLTLQKNFLQFQQVGIQNQIQLAVQGAVRKHIYCIVAAKCLYLQSNSIEGAR